jgi:hypothetical protein
MDQNVPSEPSKFLRVLRQMWKAKDKAWDLHYLAAFGETLNLIELENIKEPGTHGLETNMVARVLRLWADNEYDEGGGWLGGFVVELRDGRRGYIESYADANRSGHCGVSTLPVAAGSELPELPTNHISRLFGWIRDLPELNEYLRRVQQ